MLNCMLIFQLDLCKLACEDGEACEEEVTLRKLQSKKLTEIMCDMMKANKKQDDQSAEFRKKQEEHQVVMVKQIKQLVKDSEKRTTLMATKTNSFSIFTECFVAMANKMTKAKESTQ